MKLTDAKPGLALFLAAAIVTFGCLVAMQLVERPWFFVVLVAMHGGIALFVASKRAFSAAGFDMRAYFKMEYLMLLPFLLLMLYSFASKAGIAAPMGAAKGALVFVYAVACFAITFQNFRRMQHDARAQSGTRASKESPRPSISVEA